ncbi:hypothetical protein ACFS6H_05595 [Terrimonas rubra]|uniref:Phosphate-selective porin O and P n=1 Tax=Terrimonas rubra TaxID=1035890 RepID=A0ABW6A2B2_9BACT
MCKQRKYSFLLLLFCICALGIHASAQDEMEYEYDSETEVSDTKSAVQLVVLKKSYKLGDGLTLRSGNTFLNIRPTLQTLLHVNSDLDNLSKFNSGFSIPRSRITLVSNLLDKKINLVARINLPSNNQSTTTEHRSFNTTLQEAYIEYRRSLAHVFNIGLRADYIDSRETRFQGENLGFVTRSAISSSFDAIFDYGIRYKGNYRLKGKHLLRPYISLTTGDSRSALQKNFGGFKYGIRLDYLPFDRFAEGGEFYMDDLARESKPKLVVGVVYSYNDGTTSAMGTNGGRWLYGNSKQKVILPDYEKWGADYMFKYNGFYSLGSYVITRANIPSGITGEFRLNGTFNAYSSGQTPAETKNLVRSRLNLGSGLNVQAGYIFPSDIAVGARFTSLKSDEYSAAFADYNKFYNLVITKYLQKHDLKLQMQLGFDQLRQTLKTAESKGNYNIQVMTTIQL